jgi:hypothetical protein
VLDSDDRSVAKTMHVDYPPATLKARVRAHGRFSIGRCENDIIMAFQQTAYAADGLSKVDSHSKRHLALAETHPQ